MRVAKNFLFLLVICLPLLEGCLESFKIVVDDSGDRRPVFRLMSAGMIERSNVEIDSFNVYKFPGNAEDIVWRIESIDNTPHLVKEITYGIVPDGFRETISPRNLASGGRYVAGTLMPGKMGSVDFVLK